AHLYGFPTAEGRERKKIWICGGVLRAILDQWLAFVSRDATAAYRSSPCGPRPDRSLRLPYAYAPFPRIHVPIHGRSRLLLPDTAAALAIWVTELCPKIRRPG